MHRYMVVEKTTKTFVPEGRDYSSTTARPHEGACLEGLRSRPNHRRRRDPAELVLGAHGREAYALGFQAADVAYFLEIILRSKSTYGGGVESDGSRLVQFMRAATGGSADDSITIAEKVQMPGLQPPAHWTGRPGTPPKTCPGPASTRGGGPLMCWARMRIFLEETREKLCGKPKSG